jgi:hypothetical protein
LVALNIAALAHQRLQVTLTDAAAARGQQKDARSGKLTLATGVATRCLS